MEGMNSIRTTMAGGLFAAGASKMVGRAIGFAKSKRQLKFESKIGGASGLAGTLGGVNSAMTSSGGSASSGIEGITRMRSRSGVIGLVGSGLGFGAAMVAKSVFAVRNS